MKKLILVRAARTAWDEENRIQGTVPLPLSPAGEQTLAAVAGEVLLLGPDVLYSSGNESSGATAERLAQLCRLKTRKMAALRELNCGLWQGLRVEEIKQRYGRAYRQWRSDPNTVTPPEGESIEEAVARVRGALETLAHKNRDKNVLLVAARIVGGLIECVLSGSGTETLWQLADEPRPPQVFTFDGCGGLELSEHRMLGNSEAGPAECGSGGAADLEGRQAIKK